MGHLFEGQEFDEAGDGEPIAIDTQKEKRRYEQPFSQTPVAVSKDTRLNSTDKVVYGAVSSHVWHSDMQCFPSVNRIAQASGVSKRTAQRSLTKLEQAGYIKRTPSFIENGGQGANLYTLNPVSKMSRGECQKCHGGDDKYDTPNIRKDNIITVNTVKANRLRLKKASPFSGDNATGDNTGSAGVKEVKSTILTSNDINIFTNIQSNFKEIDRDIDFIKVGNSYKLRKRGKYALVEQFRMFEICEFLGKLGIKAEEVPINSRFSGEVLINNKMEAV